MGPDWKQQDLEKAAEKVFHVSSCTPKMMDFIYGEIWQHVWGGFRILLPSADVVRVFGYKLKLSHNAVTSQYYCRVCLKINRLENPN